MTSSKWTEADLNDQTGRIAIVTGANSGIGYETARALAAKGAHVILACRNLEKGSDAVTRIGNDVPAAQVTLLQLDLSSLQSVHEFAQAFKEQFDRLDLLINNAGVMVPPYTKTADGFELQLGTNHLGHFALTGLLMDLLSKSDNARVVNVSSLAHKMGRLNFGDLAWSERSYKPWKAYGDSKIANLYFTYELQRRFEQTGASVIATAAHPGWTATDLQRTSFMARTLNHIFAQKPIAGAWPTLCAADDEAARGGDYYGPGGFMEMNGHPKKVSSNARSRNTEIGAQLWQVSQELTGVHYP